MKFVHLECLQQWRLMSGRNKSFYQCDQCGYQYRLSRVGLYRFLTHEIIISTITFVAFLAIVALAGYLGRYVLHKWIYWMSDDVFSGQDDAEPEIVPTANDNLFRFRYGEEGELVLDTNSWTYHMLSGTLIVGLISFINMGLLFNMNFRWNGGGGNNRNNGMSFVVIIMVSIGVFRSLYLIHREVKTRVRKYGMKAAESVVLDIETDEQQPDPSGPVQDHAQPRQ